MSEISIHEYPLISVIIPCFNHARYLNEAFLSITTQNYPNIEIIVVDDGSTDNTKEVTAQHREVKYIYQTNKGLSAARNTGIRNSNGKFLIFLDADDWLLPDAINTNLFFLQKYSTVAFVSGGYQLVYTATNTIAETAYEINDHHYIHFLEENYIGMHGTVMYRRNVFDEFLFDETLKACEDYDLYLNISRKYPVYHHRKIIAAYRMHSTNMSSNDQLMLNSVLKVLDRQKRNLQTQEEKKAYSIGRTKWKRYYCKELYEKILKKEGFTSLSDVLFLFKYYPSYAFKYIVKKIIQ